VDSGVPQSAGTGCRQRASLVGLVRCERWMPTPPLPVFALQLGVTSHHLVDDQKVATQKKKVTLTFLVELLLTSSRSEGIPSVLSSFIRDAAELRK
jgi:hypothetical protein